jgi:hypothetical protein
MEAGAAAVDGASKEVVPCLLDDRLGLPYSSNSKAGAWKHEKRWHISSKMLDLSFPMVL